MSDSTEAATTLYLLTVGWPGDDQVDVGVFSSLNEAQRACPDHWTWDESTDVIRGATFRTWEAFDARSDENEPAWVYAYDLDRAYVDMRPEADQ